jgi:AAA family ATP:ADP antiporter
VYAGKAVVTSKAFEPGEPQSASAPGGNGGWASASPAARGAFWSAAGLFFLSILAYYILKPVRDALFVHALGATNLPYMLMAQSAIALVAMRGYGILYDRLPRAPFVAAIYVGIAAVAGLMWTLLNTLSHGRDAVIVAFHLWASLTGVVAVTLFWSLANEAFLVTDAQRLYGWLGAAGLLGGVVGGLLAGFLARMLTTHHLILMSATAYLGCLPLALDIVSRKHGNVIAAKSPQRSRDGLVQILRSPYLVAIALIVLLMNMVEALNENSVFLRLEHTFPREDDLTRYSGFLNGGISGFGLLIQTLVTAPVLKRHGPRLALLLLPATGIVVASMVRMSANLPLLTVGLVSSGALAYSIQQAAKEMLYIPLPTDVKYKAKSYIDVFLYRFGDAAGAIVIVLITRGLGLAPRNLCSCSMALAAVWLLASLWVGSRFTRDQRVSTEQPPTTQG